MDVFEAIKRRRSIRTYKRQDLPEGTVEKLLEAAIWAPSAGNVQPWEFIVAASPITKQGLCNAAYGQKSLGEASVVIVVCADENKAERTYGFRGKTLYCFQDTAAAIQNILLAATSLGLGSCWLGAFKEEEIKKVINAPAGVRPVALIPIGIPNETPEARHRRPVKETIHKETF